MNVINNTRFNPISLKITKDLTSALEVELCELIIEVLKMKEEKDSACSLFEIESFGTSVQGIKNISTAKGLHLFACENLIKFLNKHIPTFQNNPINDTENGLIRVVELILNTHGLKQLVKAAA